MEDHDARDERLLARLRELPGAVVAFSGGVDSTMLLHACVLALGPERVLAVTAHSPSLPEAELAEARRIAAEVGARHRVVVTRELTRAGYRKNGTDRCYHCKSELFDVLAAVARERAEAAPWPLLYGAIVDDLSDHRPGARAAEEHGVLAPLAECGFDKVAVRAWSRSHGLSTAEKPAFACLASRIPFGTEVHARVLAQLERAEDVLRGLGFRQFRVRHHDAVARIEVPPADIERLVALREAVTAGVRAAGYTYVAVDLLGYRPGALHEARLGS